MRKLLMIGLWTVCPLLSLAATPPAHEAQAPAVRGQGLDVAAPKHRSVGTGTQGTQGTNYSLAPRFTASTGLQVAGAPLPGLEAPSSFAEGSDADLSAPQRTSAEETDPAVTTPVPEPHNYALMLAGLVALGFMAVRRRS